MGPRVVAPPVRAKAKAVPKVIRPPGPPLRPTLHGAGGGGPLPPGRVEPQALRPSLPLPPGRVDPVSVEEVDKVGEQKKQEEPTQQKDQKEQATQQKDLKEQATQQKDLKEQTQLGDQLEQPHQKNQPEEQAHQKDQVEHTHQDVQMEQTQQDPDVQMEQNTIRLMEMDPADVEMARPGTGLKPKSAVQPPHGLRRCQEGVADLEIQMLALHWSDSETGYWAHLPDSPDRSLHNRTSSDSSGNHDGTSPLASSDVRRSGYVPTRAPISDTSPADVSPTPVYDEEMHH